MIEIPLTRGLVARIDDQDYALVSRYKWHAVKPNDTFYAATRITDENGRSIYVYMHRFILGLTHRSEQADHEDGNGLNNTRLNLRPCNNTQNSRNAVRSKRNTSGFKGVTFDKGHGKWRAQIGVNRKVKYLGLFDTPEEAFAARCTAATHFHGEFANNGWRAPC
jgi:AP2 domain.